MEMQQENNLAARQLFEVIFQYHREDALKSLSFSSSKIGKQNAILCLCKASVIIITVCVHLPFSFCREQSRQAPKIDLHGMYGESLKQIWDLLTRGKNF